MTGTAEPDLLPPAYAPFLPVLERLSEPLLELLQGQLAQFERLVRDFDRQEMAAQGEFEGLSGLTSRGEVAHILQSELLLRTEAPLEFLRRLAESETVYLEKQYADPGAKSVYRAAVSIGPGMLGHGRVVALAAILFLARVARERDAEFHWCMLPARDGAIWFDEVSVRTVKRFLKAAAYREMTPRDLAEAEALWETLETRPRGEVRHLDWAIGADMRRVPGADAPAVRTAANALSFTLLPPSGEEPRSAQLAVRQNGRERARAAILFPEDRVCVSALENPFRPIKPQAAGGAPIGTAIPALDGWEPHHFIAPNAQVRIVRTDEGLLVLRWSGKAEFTEHYFVPLPENMQLAGVQMYDRILSVLVHAERSGQDMLLYGQFRLQAGQAPEMLLRRVRHEPSQHLFRGRGRYAIPMLSIGEGAEFYSVSGMAYHLSFRAGEQETAFASLHHAPKTLFSNGAYRVVRVEEDKVAVLRVMKHRHTRVDDYPLPPDHGQAETMYGMAYSGGDRSLAYSVEPGLWNIPAADHGVKHPAKASVQHLRLAPCEALLLGKVRGDGVTAWVWSDARYGGEGTVRTIREQNGATRLRQPPLELGRDAMSIVQVRMSDGGIWALTADADGAPAELLHYRPQKRNHLYQHFRFPLEALRAKAVTIDLEQLRG
jgi:hypothetical protein